MSFAAVLPLSVVMVAGPQILSAVFLATSDEWRRNSLAFVVGAAVSITVIVTAGYLLGGTARESTGNDALSVAVVLVLLAAMVHT